MSTRKKRNVSRNIVLLIAVGCLTGCPLFTAVDVTPATLTVKVGETESLTATSSDPADDFEWSSNHANIASVDATGQVTGVSIGTAEIRATGTHSGSSGTCAVTVEPGFDTTKLNAIPITTAPTVDGVAESMWDDAPTLTVPLGETYDVHDPASIMDCAGCHAYNSAITVDLRAAYTDNRVYFLAEWPDPTASFTRGAAWSFVDGTWQKLTPEQSEDRISFYWPMGETVGNPYNTGGCMSKCHAYYPTDLDPHVSVNGIVDDAWLESGRADMWHSKAARGATYLDSFGSDLTIDADTHEAIGGMLTMLGYCDDQYCDVWAPDTVNGEDGGRYGDAGRSAYSNNRIADKSRPQFMETDPEDFADAMTLTQEEIDGGQCVGSADGGVSDEDAATNWPAYAALAAVVPERILRLPLESRADIEFGAVWNDGIWTAELARDLDTGTDDDVRFVPGSEYLFGVAEFDNSRHGYEHRTSDMYYMTFVE